MTELQRRSFVGRQWELGQLAQCADADGPAVTFLNGIGGMGKSTLLAVLEAELRARGVRSICLDARRIERTSRGFWQALGSELGLDAALREPTEVEADALPREVTAALASTPGISVWSTSMGWPTLVRSCALQALDEVESRALLESRRAPPALVPGIVRFAQGHPRDANEAPLAHEKRAGSLVISLDAIARAHARHVTESPGSGLFARLVAR